MERPKLRISVTLPKKEEGRSPMIRGDFYDFRQPLREADIATDKGKNTK
jgi:hypothetical protein